MDEKSPVLRRKSVLVVDDDEDIRAAIRMTLEDDGYHVVEASNGLEAAHVLRSGWLPNIVFLDKHMPGMDGDEFLSEINSITIFRQLPIVIITGDRIREGTRVYLQKPISSEKLLDVVRVLSR